MTKKKATKKPAPKKKNKSPKVILVIRPKGKVAMIRPPDERRYEPAPWFPKKATVKVRILRDGFVRIDGWTIDEDKSESFEERYIQDVLRAWEAQYGARWIYTAVEI